MKNEEHIEGSEEIKFSQEEFDKYNNDIKRKAGINCLFISLLVAFICIVSSIYYFCYSDSFLSNNLRKFVNVVQLYEEYYLYEVDTNKLIDAAIQGIVEMSEDPYGGYLPTKKAATTGKKLETGGYYGLGITYTINEDNIEIKEIIKGSPAYRANLQIGSVVKYINDVPIDEEMLEKFSKDIQERIITEYTFRLDTGEEITMVTEDVSVPKVDYFVKNEVGYISIYTFVEDTVELFENAIDEVVKNDVKEIVLDLRDNSGGNVEAVVAMIDYITEEGLIVKIDSKNEKVKDEVEYSDEFCAIDKDIPISIVVNGNTASASELMTMVLQDVYNSKVYGMTTFGKSTVLSVYTFKDESMLILSTGVYLPPSGRNIEGVGITPDVEIEDEDMEKEIDYLYTKYIKS